LYMAKLRAATALNQFFFAGDRQVPFLTVVAECVVLVVGTQSLRSPVTEVPCVAEHAAVQALLKRLLTQARKVDCKR
jgi:hypothetical protein